ncbi:MAG: hypothetical protein K2G93_05190, partial [Rikenella sp.]|nr:hypothetical protein [Rikenella sp.]
MYNVGVNGFSWSSSASGSNGYYLDFNYSRIVPNNLNNRANGFQLRCLQHLSSSGDSVFFQTLSRGRKIRPLGHGISRKRSTFMPRSDRAARADDPPPNSHHTHRMNQTLRAIAGRFQLSGDVSSVRPLGEGFINDTFIIETASDQTPNYILQRKNRHIFT